MVRMSRLISEQNWHASVDPHEKIQASIAVLISNGQSSRRNHLRENRTRFAAHIPHLPLSPRKHYGQITAALLPLKYKIDLYYPVHPLRLLRQHHAQRLR